MAHEISVKLKFRAGHRLMAPYKGKCNNPHGEGYTVICVFGSSKLDKCGMVMDFGTIKNNIKLWIDTYWDHAFICNLKDDVMMEFLHKNKFKAYGLDGNPTAENMAEYLFKIIKQTLGVKSIVKVGIVESFPESIGWYSQ